MWTGRLGKKSRFKSASSQAQDTTSKQEGFLFRRDQNENFWTYVNCDVWVKTFTEHQSELLNPHHRILWQHYATDIWKLIYEGWPYEAKWVILVENLLEAATFGSTMDPKHAGGATKEWSGYSVFEWPSVNVYN